MVKPFHLLSSLSCTN